METADVVVMQLTTINLYGEKAKAEGIITSLQQFTGIDLSEIPKHVQVICAGLVQIKFCTLTAE